MSPLEQLAAALSDYLADQACAGPDCALIVEETEVFCSQACQLAFEAWAADMRAYYDDDHEMSLSELEAAL